jgi:Mannosyltransferase (PIG-V)
MRVGERVGRLRELPREPLRVFLWSRALIWVAVLFGTTIFEAVPTAESLPEGIRNPGWALAAWTRWDGGWFLTIARTGYFNPEQSTAFFPLYPGVTRVIGEGLGGEFVIAGVAVSLTATAAAFVVLHHVGGRLLGEVTATRAVLYLALFPMGVFLSAVYSDALYLLLSLAAFALALSNRWLGAGLATGLAILTRMTGLALLPALALLALRAPSRPAALLRLAAAFPVAAAWPLWLHVKHGDAFLFLDAQKNWGRELSPAGPLSGIWHGLEAGWAGVRQLFAGPDGHVYWPHATDYSPLHTAMLNIEYLLFAALFIALAVVAWRRLGAPYGLFVLLSLAFPLSAPTEDWPLLSFPRFGLTVFPVFLALAALGERPRAHRAIVLTSAVLLGVVCAQWASGQWVS